MALDFQTLRLGTGGRNYAVLWWEHWDQAETCHGDFRIVLFLVVHPVCRPAKIFRNHLQEWCGSRMLLDCLCNPHMSSHNQRSDGSNISGWPRLQHDIAGLGSSLSARLTTATEEPVDQLTDTNDQVVGDIGVDRDEIGSNDRHAVAINREN